MTSQTSLPVGTKVVDRDGFKGTISKIVEFNGSRWYEVRFEPGEAIRYDYELTAIS